LDNDKKEQNNLTKELYTERVSFGHNFLYFLAKIAGIMPLFNMILLLSFKINCPNHMQFEQSHTEGLRGPRQAGHATEQGLATILKLQPISIVNKSNP
jgi:hypothetical protein